MRAFVAVLTRAGLSGEASFGFPPIDEPRTRRIARQSDQAFHLKGGRVSSVQVHEVTDAKLAEMMDRMKCLATRSVPGPSITPSLMVLLQHMPGSPEPTSYEMCSLLVPFNSDDEKRTALRNVGHMFAGQKKVPLALAFLSEAWLSKQKAGSKGPRPQDDPDREEIALVVGYKPNARADAMITSAPIVRLRDKIQQVGEWEPARLGSFPLLRHFYDGFFLQLQAMLAESN